jgi:hypothetical protein
VRLALRGFFSPVDLFESLKAMAEAIWYYAQDDREHGPVTAAYIAGMARSGKLRPEDLVWREGMEDWRPARVVKGLFAPKEGPAGPASDTAVLEAPLPGAPASFEPQPPETNSPSAEDEIPQSRRGDAASKAPEPPPPPVDAPRRVAFTEGEFDAGAPSPEAPTPAAAPRTAVDEDVSPWSDSFRSPTLAAIFLGLLLVVASRGCDSLASHQVLRLEARVQAAAAPTSSAAAEAMAADAQAARIRYAGWAFWRELAAVIGTVILTIGAAGAVFAGRDADRWLGVILIAVVALASLQNAALLVDRLP